MPGLFADCFEDRIQQRVFEVLGNDRAGKTEKATGMAEPFEIAVMIAGDEHAALGPGAPRSFVEVLQLDETGKIFARQPRAPE